MKPTKNLATLERRYAKLGVDATKALCDTEGYLIADGFICLSCGTLFSPNRNRIRHRHRCPNGCNVG
jgi:hypothetical protein